MVPLVPCDGRGDVRRPRGLRAAGRALRRATRRLRRPPRRGRALPSLGLARDRGPHPERPARAGVAGLSGARGVRDLASRVGGRARRGQAASPRLVHPRRKTSCRSSGRAAASHNPARPLLRSGPRRLGTSAEVPVRRAFGARAVAPATARGDLVGRPRPPDAGRARPTGRPRLGRHVPVLAARRLGAPPLREDHRDPGGRLAFVCHRRPCVGRTAVARARPGDPRLHEHLHARARGRLRDQPRRRLPTRRSRGRGGQGLLRAVGRAPPHPGTASHRRQRLRRPQWPDDRRPGRAVDRRGRLGAASRRHAHREPPRAHPPRRRRPVPPRGG